MDDDVTCLFCGRTYTLTAAPSPERPARDFTEFTCDSHRYIIGGNDVPDCGKTFVVVTEWQPVMTAYKPGEEPRKERRVKLAELYPTNDEVFVLRPRRQSDPPHFPGFKPPRFQFFKEQRKEAPRAS